jgi:hypothetical protein
MHAYVLGMHMQWCRFQFAAGTANHTKKTYAALGDYRLPVAVSELLLAGMPYQGLAKWRTCCTAGSDAQAYEAELCFCCRCCLGCYKFAAAAAAALQGPQRGMGVALVSCISGCKCEPLKIDAVNTDRSSELDSLRTQVTSTAAMKKVYTVCL